MPVEMCTEANLRDGDALLVAAEQPRFHAADPLRADDQPGRKKEVALRPAAGLEGLGLCPGARLVGVSAMAL